MSNQIARLMTHGRIAMLFVAMSVMVACGESPTAPQVAIDRVAAARVMPSVTDARVRLAPGILNAAIRTRVVHDLQELETALANGDGQKARFHVGVLNSVLADYRSQQGAVMADGADVTAIGLTLNVVFAVVGSDAVPVSF